MATGTKMWLLASYLYLASLLLAALSTVTPAVVADIVSHAKFFFRILWGESYCLL